MTTTTLDVEPAVQSKAARKLHSETRQRNKKKDIRFLDDELQMVEAAARSAGVQVSAFIRESALARAAALEVGSAKAS